MFPKLRTWWSLERAASLPAMFILLLPLIIGVFGYGFDSLRLVFIKGTVQSRVDAASQAGVAVKHTSRVGGVDRVVLGTDPADGNGGTFTAMNMAAANYQINTAGKRPPAGRVLLCSGTVAQIGTNANALIPSTERCAQWVSIVGTPIPYSQLCRAQSSAQQYGVKFSVNEEVDTTFLKILGTHTFQLSNISGVSLVRGANC